MRHFAKILFSIWIVFHLLVITVLANGGSYLGRSLGPYLTPYGNMLGVNATWNFFSPDPANTMYLQYKVRFEDEEGNETQEPFDGYLPPEKEKIVTDSSKRRLLYAMRFLLLDPNRLETLMGPWLCRQYPGASEVSIRHVLEALPTFDLAVVNPSTPVADLKTEVQSSSKVLKCRGERDEVSL